MKTGIELIAIERQEQINKHGYTVIKDVANNSTPTGPFKMMPFKIVVGNLMGIIGGVPYPENWSEESIKKMESKTKIEKLIIAGAFIAAEIDRINAIENQDKQIDLKEHYGEFWDKVDGLVDEEGWVYTKETRYLLDAIFENTTGKDIEFQKSFGRSGDNPHWNTKGSRWRPKSISDILNDK